MEEFFYNRTNERSTRGRDFCCQSDEFNLGSESSIVYVNVYGIYVCEVDAYFARFPRGLRARVYLREFVSHFVNLFYFILFILIFI